MRNIIIVLVSLFVICNSQNPNYCKNYDLLFDLDLEKTLGVWYPISLSMEAPNYDCQRFNFMTISGNARVEMTHFTTNKIRIFDYKESKRNNSFVSLNHPAFKVCTVVDTDYLTYMSGIKCFTNPNGGVGYYAFILSRTTSLPEDIIAKLQSDLISKFGSSFQFRNVQIGNECLSSA